MIYHYNAKISVQSSTIVFVVEYIYIWVYFSRFVGLMLILDPREGIGMAGTDRKGTIINHVNSTDNNTRVPVCYIISFIIL